MNSFELAEKIVAAMPGWSVCGEKDWWYATLKGPDGEELTVSCGKRKIEVEGAGIYENGQSFLEDGEKKLMRCGFSVGRPVEAIVRTIQKKLLPQYREIVARAREKRQEYCRFNDGVKALGEELAAILGEKVSRLNPGRCYVHYYGKGRGGIYGEVDVYSPNKLDLRLRSIPPDLARKILKLILV